MTDALVLTLIGVLTAVGVWAGYVALNEFLARRQERRRSGGEHG